MRSRKMTPDTVARHLRYVSAVIRSCMSTLDDVNKLNPRARARPERRGGRLKGRESDVRETIQSLSREGHAASRTLARYV